MIQEIGGSQSSGGNVPPPPAEVKVRTMRSDVEGIVKMGGGLPQFRTVAVEGAEPRGARPFSAGSADGSSKSFLWWIVAIGIVALGLIAWFGYAVLLKK
jgi:hypothetical protein